MKIRTTYQLEPGDTIYLVTRERDIKTITLTEDHLDLVNEIEHNYDEHTPYYNESGALHQDEDVAKHSHAFRPSIIKTNIWLLTNELDSQETEIPLYRIYEEDEHTYLRKLNTEDYPVFAFTTLELAKNKVRDLFTRDVKNDIARNIEFVVVNNTDNMPIKSYNYIRKWDDYIKVISNNPDLLIFIKLYTGQTFKQEDFETYVTEQVNEKVK